MIFSARNCRMLSNQVSLHFRHMQIFFDNLPNTVFFSPIQLSCDHSDMKLMITQHQLSYPHNLGHRFCLLKASSSWNQVLLPCDPLWILSAAQKHVCPARHLINSVNFLKYFSVCDFFFSSTKPNQTFHFFRFSDLIVEQFQREQVLTNVCEKMPIVAESRD